jgi:hypothetical protein
MSLQVAADDLVKWSRTNGLVINESKTKEMVNYFGRKFNRENDISYTVINNKVIDCVNSFKLLGVYIASDLSWDFHVDYMIKKVVKHLFCIRSLEPLLTVELVMKTLLMFTVLSFVLF